MRYKAEAQKYCHHACMLLYRRWYYDPKTEWYYGGEPVSWTQKPGLASASMFGVAPHEGGPTPQPSAAAAVAGAKGSSGGKPAAAAGGGSRAQEAAAAAAAATGQKVVVRRTVMHLPSHPQSAIGGHQMPTSGRIGGAKGVGADGEADDAAAAAKVRLMWLMLLVAFMHVRQVVQHQLRTINTAVVCAVEVLQKAPQSVVKHTLLIGAACCLLQQQPYAPAAPEAVPLISNCYPRQVSAPVDGSHLA